MRTAAQSPAMTCGMRSVRTRVTASHLADRRCYLLLAMTVALGISGCGGSDTPVSSVPTVQALTATCASLKGQTVAGVTVTDTKRVEANGPLNPAGMCQVSGTRAPFLDI